MARRNTSKFASASMGLVLLLVVFYGCRAFAPEPVLVNTPPDTFITGAPAETTGTIFRRHMYWYGDDVDGDVVQFIFAITDSTVRDPTRPDIDEEDARFDPADDILTLESNDWRTVGYTDKSDSVFVFTVDRVSNTAKDITFHVVAVDDRGAIDPTPARLHFFNNSLGNPVLRFHISTFDDNGAETNRWVGTAMDGPKLPGDVIWPWAPDPDTTSPEDSPKPFIGFLNHFQICWEASSPNGAILGYRYQATETPNPKPEFLPVKIDEETGSEVPDWTLDTTCFDFQNNISPDDLDPGNLPEECASGWKDCPELVRLEAGEHRVKVIALDEALVQSTAQAGELRYAVNYPPETELVRDSGWPRYTTDFGETWKTFSDHDTLPADSYVLFKQFGLDRLERNRDNPLIQDLPCCDVPFSNANPDSEVRYQTRIADARAINDQGALIFWKTSFSPAEYADTLGFHVGPFDYTVTFRSQDEHQTADTTPDEIHFTGGFAPQITTLSPGNGDSLILRSPLVNDFWPNNTVPYTVSEDIPPLEGQHRYWDGTKYVFADSPQDGWIFVPGNIYRYRVKFTGQSDPREPLSSIRSWAYEIFGQYDPTNRIKEGAGHDIFSRFDAPATPDEWEMSEDRDGVEIFVPLQIWITPRLFDPDQPPPLSDMGKLLARQLGRIRMRVVGKTKAEGDDFSYCFLTVRETCGKNATRIPLASLGRRTEERRSEFAAYLGLEQGGTGGQITELWPPEGYIPEEGQ